VFTVDAPSGDAQDEQSSPDAAGERPAPDRTDTDRSPRQGVPAPLVVAALASLAAGAIHAAAAGAHGEARQSAIAFAVLAAAQLAWGGIALVRSHRLITLAGIAVNVAAVGGWALAKTSGIGFVEGLEESEGVQFADTAAAALAAVAVLAAVAALLGRSAWARRPRPGIAGVAAVAALALALPAMVLTGSHAHGAGGHGAGGHDEAAGGHGGEHAAPALAAEPYNATIPVNLGGVEGVSAEQQARAEDLVELNLEELPQWAAEGPNQADAEWLNSQGYYSIGDAGTGFEHWMNWPSLADDKILDPDQPESLVFKVDGPNEKTLAAAMYMLEPGDQLGDEPDIGGPLTQWHVHQDLCYAGEPNQWVVADVAMPPEECRPGTTRLGEPIPMIHVWIEPHECGPFSALDGIGGGQVAEGEEQACNHAHGASNPDAISSEAEATIEASGANADAAPGS
jgi:hypothetical protein